MTLPRWTSRLAALALLAGVLVLFYAVVVAPLASGYVETGRAIAQAREALGRYQRIARSREAFEQRLEELRVRQSASGVYLSGSTDALAGAELQELVNKTVEAGGGRQRSVQILPVKTDGEFRRVGVRVQMTATVAQLARVLYALEAGPPYLFVDNLDIRNRRARRRRNRPIEMDPTLLIRLDLSGYLRPEAG